MDIEFPVIFLLAAVLYFQGFIAFSGGNQPHGESIDPSSILNWEKGKTNPSIRYYPAIMQFLGIRFVDPD